MLFFKFACLAAICFLHFSCAANRSSVASGGPRPPIAKKVSRKLKKHGHVRVDDYYWLRERENPEVIAYLKAENRYTKRVMGYTEDLQKTLFKEIKGRIKPNDESVPYKLEGYYYYTRFEKGKEYAIHCRKKGSLQAPEEIMLDENELAEGHSFFSLRGLKVSSGRNILAYAVDTRGRRIYKIHFKNLDNGEIPADEISQVTGNMAWANDNKTLFYTRQDLVTLRPYQVFCHVLGTDPSTDRLVYEEKDDTFYASLSKSKSRKFLFIELDQTLSSEIRFLDADTARGEFKIFLSRERDHEYHVDHYKENFFIITNFKAKNFRLMKTSIGETKKKKWKEVIPHRKDVLLEDMELFADFLVVSERKNGLEQIRIIPWEGGEEHTINFKEAAYSTYISTNPEFDTKLLRFGYSSLATPNSIYDYHMVSKKKALKKQDKVLGGFQSKNYKTERLHAIARDGSKVPISLVYRKGTRRNGSNPLLLYGYGSYGSSMDASFRSAIISLLDRNFIYAIAHIRGGEELGRHWYEDGKLLKKRNTFTDFIDCAEFLVRKKYTNPGKLFAAGGSAGGLLMGAVFNMRPDLFHGVIAAVPFVDVITTMLDESIPLTTSEYDEWGNPNEKKFYDYMLSYSPYDNVEAGQYPHLLVTTGLHDSQVQYWEPAKWVAKLRAMKKGGNRLLLKTNMDAGHGGTSGRYRRYRETALTYAFLLSLVWMEG